MLKRNKILSVAALAALFASPALADGRNRVVPQGPTPLQPHAETFCPDGVVVGDTCRIVRTVVQNPAPEVRRVVRQAAPAPVQASYDFSGFTGGVGSAVGGGTYGGGGRVIVIGSDRRYSGIRQSYSHSGYSYSYSGSRFSIGGGGGCGCN